MSTHAVSSTRAGRDEMSSAAHRGQNAWTDLGVQRGCASRGAPTMCGHAAISRRDGEEAKPPHQARFARDRIARGRAIVRDARAPSLEMGRPRPGKVRAAGERTFDTLDRSRRSAALAGNSLELADFPVRSFCPQAPPRGDQCRFCPHRNTRG
jgi:hypothetical protein